MKIKTTQMIILQKITKHKPPWTKLCILYPKCREHSMEKRNSTAEKSNSILQPRGEKGANPHLHQNCHQSIRCTESWTPNGCYCPCPQTTRSWGCYLWTPCCYRCCCRCCCYCHHRGSPSPLQIQLLWNTKRQKVAFCKHFTRDSQALCQTLKRWNQHCSVFQIGNKSDEN